MATVSETLSSASKTVRELLGSALSSVHAGDDKIVSKQSANAGRVNIAITSSAFTHGMPIPRVHTPQGANTSPQLSWSGVPFDARELVLIVEDPDAPFPNPFVHWIMHRISAGTMSLPAGVPTEQTLATASGAVQGQNDAKTRGWFGPKPPLGHGVHHYHFQLFALDVALNLSPDATVKELSKAIAGHVIADGEIVGTYEMTKDQA